MLTGGIPPGIDTKCSADEAYRRLFRRVITQVTDIARLIIVWYVKLRRDSKPVSIWHIRCQRVLSEMILAPRYTCAERKVLQALPGRRGGGAEAGAALGGAAGRRSGAANRLRPDAQVW